MNYSGIYDKIIERAKTRILIGYSENHHIVPKCLGGTNCKSNLVKLTPEEHYLVHQLLVKIYPGNKKLVYAVAMMCHSNDRMIRGNKLYGWIRRALSETRRNVPKTEEHKKKLSLANKGQAVSAETRAKMSLARIGNKNGCGNKGVRKTPRTDEHKKNLGTALKKPKSENGRRNISEARKKHSINLIICQKEYYNTIFRLLDEGKSRKEIREATGIRERTYYTIKKDRQTIETIIREYSDAQ